MGGYAATKSAVDTIARTAAIELADRKILVAPGLTDTPINQQTPADIKNAIAAAVPLKRIGQAGETKPLIFQVHRWRCYHSQINMRSL